VPAIFTSSYPEEVNMSNAGRAFTVRQRWRITKITKQGQERRRSSLSCLKAWRPVIKCSKGAEHRSSVTFRQLQTEASQRGPLRAGTSSSGGDVGDPRSGNGEQEK
jgi:hypothetical protein